MSQRVPNRRLGLVIFFALLLLVYALRQVLSPIIAGLFLAYLLSPVREVLVKQKVPGVLASVLSLGALLLLVVGFVLLLVPPAVADLNGLLKQLPYWAETVSVHIERTFHVEVPGTWRELMASWNALSRAPDGGAGHQLGNFAGLLQTVLGHSLVVLGLIGQAVLTPVFAFYFLDDFDHVVKRLQQLVPPPMRARVFSIIGEVDSMMSGFLRGQLSVCAVLAVVYALALSALNVRFGVLIGLITGLINFIPYAGIVVGLTLSMLSLLIEGGSTNQLILLPIVFVAITVLDAMIFTPRIVGGKVGLSPAYVIAAVMIFGHLFGFVGILLAVPLMSAARIAGRHGLEIYQRQFGDVAS